MRPDGKRFTLRYDMAKYKKPVFFRLIVAFTAVILITGFSALGFFIYVAFDNNQYYTHVNKYSLNAVNEGLCYANADADGERFLTQLSYNNSQGVLYLATVTTRTYEFFEYGGDKQGTVIIYFGNDMMIRAYKAPVGKNEKDVTYMTVVTGGKTRHWRFVGLRIFDRLIEYASPEESSYGPNESVDSLPDFIKPY